MSIIDRPMECADGERSGRVRDVGGSFGFGHREHRRLLCLGKIVAGTRPPPVHAMDRGIAIEGLGCILAGLWGSGNGTTSYSENIGSMGVTKVKIRKNRMKEKVRFNKCFRLCRVGGDSSGRFNDEGLWFLVEIWRPFYYHPRANYRWHILRPVLNDCSQAGLAKLQFLDLNSSRNLLVPGSSIFFSLVNCQIGKKEI